MTVVALALLRHFQLDPDQRLWSVGELTRALGFSTHAIRGTLRRLMEEGWITCTAENPFASGPRRPTRLYYRLTPTRTDHAAIPLHDGGQGDLVAALVDL